MALGLLCHALLKMREEPRARPHVDPSHLHWETPALDELCLMVGKMKLKKPVLEKVFPRGEWKPQLEY